MYKYIISESTKILTNNGFKKLTDITCEDLILDKDENNHTFIYESTVNTQTYNVTFQGDNNLNLSGNTLFYMSKAGSGLRGARTLRLEDILKYFDKQSEKQRPRWPLVDLKPIPCFDLNKETNLPLEPYTLGFLLGDGTFRAKRSTPFCSTDTFIIEKIISKGFAVKSWKDSKGMITYNIPNIHGKIDSLGLKGTCSATKFFPELPYTIEDRIHLLQGMMDADGCVNTDSSIEITLKSESMINWVKDCIERLGGTATKKAKRGYCKAYNFEGDYWRLYVRHPEASILFSLPRKIERTKPKPLRNRIIAYSNLGFDTCKIILSEAETIILDGYIPVIGEELK